MDISVLANGIVDFFHPGRGEGYIREAGFDTVALSLGGMIADKKPFVAKTSFQVRLVIAPSSCFISKELPYADPEDVMRAAEIVKNMSGVRYFLTDSTDDALIDRLISFFDGSGIKTLITNRTKYFSGRYIRDRFCETREVLSIMGKYGHDRLGFAFNLGEANLAGRDPAQILYALKDVTDAVIVSENDGIHSVKYLPFTLVHTLDWGSFFRGMRKIDFDGELVFDAGSTMGAAPVPLCGEKVKELYRMAEYFRWQIGMDRMVAKYPKRVLFGAGNMCRNYMRDYGKDYPPMFTVDNDSKVWGSTFEGLQVEPPDALLKLDEDVAVFICITYYNEIREQLRAMGLKNPIEYFNDEFPNTVFEGKRLEREWTE